MLKILLNLAFCCFFIISSTVFAADKPLADKMTRKIEDREPEAATGLTKQQGVVGQDFMIVAANPYASKAGYNILAKGGSAIDAAIAVQLV